MYDGSELPRALHSDGGVAVVIRSQQATSSTLKGKGQAEPRGLPPHMATNFAGLQFEGEDVLYDDQVYGVSTITPTTAKRPNKKPDDAPPSSNPHHTRSKPAPPPEPTPNPPKTVTQQYPSTPPTVNTRDAFKNNRKIPTAANKLPPPPAAKPQKPDITMADGTRPAGKAPPLYHFTSSIQDMVDGEALQDKILSTPITVTLRELIGSSADLQRRFANLTKIRREYTDKTVSLQTADLDPDDFDENMLPEDVGCVWATVADDDDCEFDDGLGPIQLEEQSPDGFRHSQVQVDYDPRTDTEDAIFDRYASAVKIHKEPLPLFAMVVGRFKGTFGGVTVNFMVDTGSELNLVSNDLYQKTGLPIDMDGTRWSLKGIHGNAVRLGGCVRDVPLRVAGHDFDHHFFVSQEGVGTGQHDVILGQPWLQWYMASLNYTRAGGMYMRLWQKGDTENQVTVTIPLCNPGAERNTANLKPIKRPAPVIEESMDVAEN
ncbi:hypothetical protein Hypma_004877 [Hypsizygus marmoreus]|uniref:DUF4100 domain-containing protein n=1 Tax=Hypsizygus marmoreus TaxID=39966 RepID=A0A369KGP0_HYPMA|nr:hypothetical protein Hypma_004877 [Hypsizygus marmoreus]